MTVEMWRFNVPALSNARFFTIERRDWWHLIYIQRDRLLFQIIPVKSFAESGGRVDHIHTSQRQKPQPCAH